MPWHLVLFFILHTVTLTWTDGNPPGTTWTVYRGSDRCFNHPVMQPIASGLTSMTYTDTNVSGPGGYCYDVTATYGGLESDASGTQGVVLNK